MSKNEEQLRVLWVAAVKDRMIAEKERQDAENERECLQEFIDRRGFRRSDVLVPGGEIERLHKMNLRLLDVLKLYAAHDCSTKPMKSALAEACVKKGNHGIVITLAQRPD